MNKWIAIPVIAVLAVGLIVGGYFLLQQNNKLTDDLKEADAEIVALEGDVSTLEGDVSTLEGDVSTLEGTVSTLQTDLTGSEAEVSTLEADLETADAKAENLQASLSTQQTINSSLSDELKKIQGPRHFSSLSELVDWLQEDATDTEYAGQSIAKLAYILQVRALRDGYLLPALIYTSGDDGGNLAAIGDEYWGVNPDDDDTSFLWDIEPLPSHPLP